MATLKTQPNDGDVTAFLNDLDDEQKKSDCLKLVEIFEDVTNMKPVMWGDSIIGFGSYHYKYKSGREGDWFITGFSPRKKNLTLYIMPGFDRFEELTDKLGKFTTGTSCLYINKLTDVDETILKELIRQSVEYMQQRYPTTK